MYQQPHSQVIPQGTENRSTKEPCSRTIRAAFLIAPSEKQLMDRRMDKLVVLGCVCVCGGSYSRELYSKEKEPSLEHLAGGQ